MGVKVLVRDWLGVIAPPWRRRGGRPTTPANVRLPAVALAKAGIDPCKKKTKRREFARWREGVPPVLPAGRSHYHGVFIAYLLLRQRCGEVRKKIAFWVGNAP